jgi:hypothetical protein
MDVSSGGGGCARGVVSLSAPLRIEKVAQWCDEAERGLNQTLGYDRDQIVAAVTSGVCELWRLWDGEAWAVTRVEMGVLTCCCYQGTGARAWMRWLMEQGERMKLTAIQFYSRRPGLQRMFSEFKFEALETVYRAEVKRCSFP